MTGEGGHLRLKEHFDFKSESYEDLMDRVPTAVSVVFLATEQWWRKIFAMKNDNCDNCYKHFGLDVIIDADLKAHVIEINGQPGMALSRKLTDHYSVTKN